MVLFSEGRCVVHSESEGTFLDYSVAVESENYPWKGPRTDLRQELGVRFSRELLRPLNDGVQARDAGRLGIRNSCLTNCRPNFCFARESERGRKRASERERRE